jgi:DNA-binding XRE family transcriptional regulator
MAANDAQRERAIKLAERLIALAPETDESVLRRAQQILDRLKTPMLAVLQKVPGGSVTEKAKKIGITRQAYYCWARGEYRPNLKQSKKLAALTGYSVGEIRGR